ncbi:hypothetical protein DFP72DRAFT_1064533 [Ephemerocybe angulata]|uniref:Uncharacterized protein n=1 Tax=Ephemerocybe angulata TaxID=980116 RepID=A0A8H6MBH0_9AGAR|nr:hypothetical protein DFP72DRAFT_1064533 [Tulosesus angulatus]
MSGENLMTREFGMEGTGSALSGALGMSQQQQQQQEQAAARQFILHNNPGEAGSDESGASASASPASSGGRGRHRRIEAGEQCGGEEMQRPMAKRLASSVLESGSAKAMKHDEAGGTESGIALPQLHTVVGAGSRSRRRWAGPHMGFGGSSSSV